VDPRLLPDPRLLFGVAVISGAMSAPTPKKLDHDDATTCPRCGESHELAKVKGCIKCLKCGFKFDCNGW
jgi:hypothetical protein